MARLPSLTDLVSWLKGLDRRVSKLETAPRLGNAAISDGNLTVRGGHVIVEDGGIDVHGKGRIDIVNGGSFLTADGQSRALFYAGGLAETVPGTPQGYGVYLRRLDGSFALHFSDDADDEQPQRIKVYDRNKYMIFAEDPQGDGLEWPVIPIPFERSDYQGWPGTTSGTFTELLQGGMYRQHRRALVMVKHTTDESTTTGEVRVTIGGAQVGATVSVEFAIGTSFIGPFDVPGSHGSSTTLRVEARRTAGPGNVKVTVARAEAAGWF